MKLIVNNSLTQLATHRDQQRKTLHKLQRELNLKLNRIQYSKFIIHNDFLPIRKPKKISTCDWQEIKRYRQLRNILLAAHEPTGDLVLVHSKPLTGKEKLRQNMKKWALIQERIANERRG